MANISKLSQLINGIQRQVDLSANNLVVGSLQVTSGGNTLTNAILGNLIALQNGTDFADGTNSHTHDGRYFTESEIGSAVAGSAGSKLVGDNNSYSNFTPAAATVKGALSGIDSALGVESAARIAADLTFVKLDGSRAMTADLDLGTHKIVNLASGSAASDAVNKGQLDAEATARAAADTTNANAIAAETTRAEAAEAALQAAINAAASGLQWRPGAFAATEDADLNAAADGTDLSTLLPFSDDDADPNTGTFLQTSDFADGEYLLSKNGASSKLFKIVDVSGTLKVTTVGVTALAAGHTFLVMNDLPDSPGTQEGVAIYAFTGADLIKVGDMDWSLATGIDLSADFTSTTGTVSVGDSVELAIAKLVGNLAAEATARAAADTTLQSNIDAEASARAAEDLTFIKKDGSRAFTADQSMGSHKLTNLANGTVSSDAVNKGQLDAEASARAAADSTLQSNIDAEVSRAEAAEGALDTRVTALEAGSGSAQSVAKDMVAGQSFAANTSFVVRMGMNSLSETANRVYKADKDASIADKFHIIGIAVSTGAVSAGGTIKVYLLGPYILGSSDTAFSSADVGKPVWLAASGAFSVTAPSAANEAVVKVGVVQDTNALLIDRQIMGVA